MASYVPWWQTPWAGGNMSAPATYPNQIPPSDDAGVVEDRLRRERLQALSPEATNAFPNLGQQAGQPGPTGAVDPKLAMTGAARPKGGLPVVQGMPFTQIPVSPVGTRAGNVILEANQRPTAALGGSTPQEWQAMSQQQQDDLMMSWRPQPAANSWYSQNYCPTAMPNLEAFRTSDTRDHLGNIVTNYNNPAFQAAMTAYTASQRLPLDQSKLDLDRMSLLGIPGTPGRLQTDAARVAQEGRAADIQHGPDAVNERNFTAFLQSVLQSGGSIQDARRRWVENGSPLPPSQGGGSLLGGSNTAPPTQAQTGATSPPPPGTNSASTTTAAATATAPPLTESPLSQMQNALRLIRAQGGGVPGQMRDLTTDDVTRFVNNLGGRFVQENIQTLMPFMVQQFGSNVVDPWFSQRTWRLGQQTPDEVARQAIMQAVNARQPQTVGNSSVNRQMPTRWLNPITWLPW